MIICYFIWGLALSHITYLQAYVFTAEQTTLANRNSEKDFLKAIKKNQVSQVASFNFLTKRLEAAAPLPTLCR